MVADQPTTSIELSVELVRRIEARLPQTEWDDPDTYAAFVLEEVLSQVEDADTGGDMKAVDEDQVKDRLESLGYLNE